MQTSSKHRAISSSQLYRVNGVLPPPWDLRRSTCPLQLQLLDPPMLGYRWQGRSIIEKTVKDNRYSVNNYSFLSNAHDKSTALNLRLFKLIRFAGLTA